MKRNLAKFLTLVLLVSLWSGVSLTTYGATFTEQLPDFDFLKAGVWQNGYIYDNYTSTDGTLTPTLSGELGYDVSFPSQTVTEISGGGAKNTSLNLYTSNFGTASNLSIECYVPTGNVLRMQLDVTYYKTDGTLYSSASYIGVPLTVTNNVWTTALVPISSFLDATKLAVAPYAKINYVKSTVYNQSTKTAYIRNIGIKRTDGLMFASPITYKDYDGKTMVNNITSDLKTIDVSFTGGTLDGANANIPVLYDNGTALNTSTVYSNGKATITINSVLFNTDSLRIDLSAIRSTTGNIVSNQSVPFKISNKIILFDDDVRVGTLGTGSSIDSTVHKTGSKSLKFIADGNIISFPSLLDLSEVLRDNWSYTFYIRSSGPKDANGYFPFYNSYSNGTWYGINGTWLYNTPAFKWVDAQSWSQRLIGPFRADAMTGSPTELAFKTINVLKGGCYSQTVWLDQYVLNANTKVNIKSIKFYDNSGIEILNGQNRVPKTIKVNYDGIVNTSNLTSGASLKAGITPVSISLTENDVDAETAVYTINGTISAGTSYTFLVNDYKNYLLKAQGPSMSSTFSVDDYYGIFMLGYKNNSTTVLNPQTTAFNNVTLYTALSNSTAQLKTVTAIVSYKESNELLAVKLIPVSVPANTIDYNASLTMDLPKSVVLNSNNIVSVYLWSDLDNIKPYKLSNENFTIAPVQ